MKAFMYVRQSVGTSDPDESLSIESQIEECLKFAKSKDIEIIDIFKDANSSGRLYPEGFESLAMIDATYQKWISEVKKIGQYRKGLGKLFKRLDEVDYIICYDLTRLHRSLQGSFLENLIMQELLKHNTKVMTIKEGEIDFNKFTDTLVTSLTSQINSEQLKIQREKSKAAMKHLKVNGEWSGACFKSFGYRSTGRNKEVEIDPIKGPLVPKIFEMFLNGHGYYIICRYVNDILTKYGTTALLGKTNLYRILHNPIYFGYYYENGELIKAKPNEGKELISFETWKAAQELLKKHTTIPIRDKKNWLPLRGKFECGYCGHPIGAVTYYSGVSMRCMHHALTKLPSCKCGLTWYTLEEGGTGILDAMYPLTAIYYIDKLKNANSPETSKKIEDYEMKMIGIRNKMKKFKELYLKDIIDEQEFDKTIKTLQSSLDDYQKAVDAMKLSVNNNTYTTLKCLLDVSRCLNHELSQGEAEIAMNYAINKITIFKEKIVVNTIYGNFELPVKRIWKSKELPLITVIYPQEHLDEEFKLTLVYHFGDFNPNEDKFETIATLGNTTIGLI